MQVAPSIPTLATQGETVRAPPASEPAAPVPLTGDVPTTQVVQSDSPAAPPTTTTDDAAGSAPPAVEDEAKTDETAGGGTPVLGGTKDKDPADSSTKSSTLGGPTTTTVLKTEKDTPTPASPPAAAPKAKASGPASTPAGAQGNKKKKGGLAALFLACIPCISNDAHDEPASSSSAGAAGPSSKAKAKAAPTSEKPGESEKAPATPLVKTDASPAASSPSTPVAPAATTTPAQDAEESALDTATVAANNSRAGATLSQEETEGVTSGAVMPPGKETPAKGRRRRSGKGGPESLITSVPEPGQRQVQHDSDDSDEDASGSEDDEDDEEDEEQGLIARGGVGIPIGEDGLPHPLLNELAPELKGRKCLVLDLDETLVHSSFKQMVHQADYVVPVEIENQYHNVYVIKRPGVDHFLKAMGEIYEVVIFTASLSKYADPVLDQLDIHRVVKHRLFRESCYNNKGSYVKDLSQLGRPMSECIIIDNSPASYVFHPNNAVPISSWFNDPHDTELTDLVPFLTDLERVDDVRGVLDAGLYQHLA
ncbi:hypothetical protein RQP46_004944 [Phenoliferia psychrophenolica]